MLRAGLIRKTAAGIYSFLPLGYRSVRKVEQIVREEMDAIGCQELLLPIVQPAELWHESGRWSDYGPELARLTDRAGREFCLGPTHEEIITSLVRNEVRSYRELPLSLYQINMKFRDEMRPRFGLLRGREFIMKDAYSFHADQESLRRHYDEQAEAYGRICDRLGLEWRAVEADSGQIGGKVTKEFMALADNGEAEIVYCACGWAANVEAAAVRTPDPVTGSDETGEPAAEMHKVHTPGIQTIAELAHAFRRPEHDFVKSMAASTEDGELVLFCIPGDRELNPLKAALAAPGAELLDEDQFEAYGISRGFIGPAGAPGNTRVIADRSLVGRSAWVTGANETDYHLFDAAPGRDFVVDEWADLITARAGDGCPACDGRMLSARGIEVSQVFQLGTKYSEAMSATFNAEDGSERPFIMGCYGVGITRSLAAVIEQHNDENGIAWPMSVAPVQAAVIPLAVGDDVLYPVAERIFGQLADAGVETLIDDRDERPGVKFADADLIGYPIQVVIGKKGVTAGIAEIKIRATGERHEAPIEKAAEQVVAMVREELSRLGC